ncbi:MAG: Hsp20/alpha crystallin family protein [Deltaproteobacteria bacterium]|nr:Hsp20/alpha crystallin family protein [Deltaproteobacteria bacterium]
MPSDKKEEAGFDLGLGGLFKGLSNLMDAAIQLAEKGESLSKSGEIHFSGLDRLKGLKDLKGVYGVRISTLADGRPSVRPFGNIKKSPAGPVVEETREPLVDVFDDAEGIQIVAEMPGVSQNDIEVDVRGDIVGISAISGVRKYQKELLLSRVVQPEDMTWTYQNGILEIVIKTTAGKS